MKLDIEEIQRIVNLFLFSRVNVYVFLFGYESDKKIGHTRVGMQLKRNMENWLGNVWKFYSCDDNLAWLGEFPQVSLNYFIVQSTHVLRRFFPFSFSSCRQIQCVSIGKEMELYFLCVTFLKSFFFSIFNREKRNVECSLFFSLIALNIVRADNRWNHLS